MKTKIQSVTFGLLGAVLAIGFAGCSSSVSSDNLSYQYTKMAAILVRTAFHLWMTIALLLRTTL